jgi:hypothetical protein
MTTHPQLQPSLAAHTAQALHTLWPGHVALGVASSSRESRRKAAQPRRKVLPEPYSGIVQALTSAICGVILTHCRMRLEPGVNVTASYYPGSSVLSRSGNTSSTELIWHVSFPIRRQEPRIRRSLAVLSLRAKASAGKSAPLGRPACFFFFGLWQFFLSHPALFALLPFSLSVSCASQTASEPSNWPRRARRNDDGMLRTAARPANTCHSCPVHARTCIPDGEYCL